MTIRLLVAYNGAPVGARLSRDLVFETEMVSTNKASFDLTGSFQWPRESADEILGPFNSLQELEAAYPASKYAGFTSLVGAAAPYAVYFSDGQAWLAKVVMSYNPATGESTLSVSGTAFLRFNSAYDLLASIVPRTDTLASLQANVSGGNEIAVAADVPAIVLLSGPEGAGVAKVFSPMSPGIWDEATATFQGVRGIRATSTPENTTKLPYLSNTSVGVVGGTRSLMNGGDAFLIGGDTTLATKTGGNAVVMGGMSDGGMGAGGLAVLASPESMTGISVGGTEMYATVGFYETPPIQKPTVTGSRGGNAALTSLLTQLSNLGLITNSSVA